VLLIGSSPSGECSRVRVSVSFYLQDFSYDDSKVEFNVDAPNGVVMKATSSREPAMLSKHGIGE